MIAWATSVHAKRVTDPAASVLQVSVLRSNVVTRELLSEWGYQRTDPNDDLSVFTQSLERLETLSGPPEGCTVRAVNGPDEWPARAELHRDVWQSSRFTDTAYAEVRETPLYRADLDLVAVAPNGELVGYCIVWYDPVSQSGEFEPVGTHEAYRGRGIGRAVIDEGLRRLGGLGAGRAVVYSFVSSQPAIALYRSAGFTEQDRFETYRRPSF